MSVLRIINTYKKIGAPFGKQNWSCGMNQTLS
jgi:hypothetical protein